MKKILIYQDYVDHNNNAHNITAFKKAVPDSNIEFCDADDILNGCLTPEIDLFVIPGGADLYFCEKLNGKPNQHIREYVETGGTYLGICAGSYYGCKNIEWAKNSPHQICEPRELQFFNGNAFGPIYEFLEDQNIEKSWDQAVILKNEDDETSTTLYRAGPYFSEPEDNSTTVLARYAELKNTPPAILLCSVGKGRALLCGP
ncbi:MAG: BPL-N domain-containing protein, partial [Bdellovibrionales bacterium]